MKTFQHLRALNDPSGNPQRLWVVYELRDPGPEYRQPMFWYTVAVIDEGYGNAPEYFRSLPSLPSVDISRSRYHALVKDARARGILEYAS